jgi:hypothetical protein
LEKIPLIPDVTFKQHPSGEDFAYWITVMYTGEPRTMPSARTIVPNKFEKSSSRTLIVHQFFHVSFAFL